jgi:hypothetical protein
MNRKRRYDERAVKVIERHEDEQTTAAVSASLYGGPILFLLAQAWNLRTIPRVSSRVQMIGSVAPLILGFGALAVPAYVALIVAALGLAIVAILDRS